MKSKSCFVVCVQGDAAMWDRASYVADAAMRHAKGSDVAIVHIGDIPSSSKGAALLHKDTRRNVRFVRVGSDIEKKANDIFARHYQFDFAPIVLVKLFMLDIPELAEYDRLIVLDADMDIAGDLSPLAEIPLERGIGGVRDKGWPSWKERVSERPVPPELFGDGNPCGKELSSPLYNGGLLVLDRTTLPADFKERVDWALKADESVVFPWLEQDMLNLAFDFTEIPVRFNTFCLDGAKPPADAVVHHYVGREAKKPFDALVAAWLAKHSSPVKKSYKIVVYAICCDENKFVSRWMDSMKEADAVVVLDTGSRDGTAEALRSLGAIVEKKRYVKWNNTTDYYNIKSNGGDAPWRFDEARNDSIDLAIRRVPDADILVCTDLDEVLLPGWRDKLETAWRRYTKKNGVEPTTAQYEYVWNFNADGSDGTKFLYEKVHSVSSGARWTHPVHEILSYNSEKRMVRVEGMRLEHHADPAKSRGQYLSLLELSVAEDPADDRNTHYLGREYMFRRRWDNAIRTLEKHLSLPRATWRAERAASMRYIARCYGEKKDTAMQEMWLRRAMLEEPAQREAALELAELMHSTKQWGALVRACEACLAVKERRLSYLTKAEAWGYRPWDLYSIGLWYSGCRKEAIEANRHALELSPENARLKSNDAVMRKMMGQRKQ